MLQGVIPQAVIVLRHGIAFGATGVMAVFNQADRNTCGFCAHLRTITVHAVEKMPFIVTVSIRSHKRAAIAERVKGPDTLNAEKGYTVGRYEFSDTYQAIMGLIGTPESYYMGTYNFGVKINHFPSSDPWCWWISH